MKALTICQPYAELVVRGDKLVENRTWPTRYRGPLLIHAGKSRQWLEGDNYGLRAEDMVFGAIIGVAKLADCVSLCESGTAHCAAVRRRWPWFDSHQHVEGPFCLVLTECRRFAEPIPYRGAQGLFDVPDEVVRECITPNHPSVSPG